MKTPAAPPYDLATTKADFPPWTGKPARSILICTHMRSGSTLLGEAMYATGRLGCPIEYLHKGFEPHLAALWKTPDLSSYLRELYRRRTDPGGTFSIKLFWPDIEALCVRTWPDDAASLRQEFANTPATATLHRVHSLLRELFPNPNFAFLWRRDRLRQAVSCWRASHERVWRSIPGVQEPQPSAEPAYDYERILNLVHFGDHARRGWNRFFEANAIQPYCLYYENLVGNFPAALRGLFDHLGLREVSAHPPRMRRQADAVTEQFLVRFLQDYSARQSGASV